MTTKDDAYYAALNPAQVSIGIPGWGSVSALAWISLAHHRHELTPVADQRLIVHRITTSANSLASAWQSSAYRVSMQTSDPIFLSYPVPKASSPGFGLGPQANIRSTM